MWSGLNLPSIFQKLSVMQPPTRTRRKTTVAAVREKIAMAIAEAIDPKLEIAQWAFKLG